MSTPKLGEVIYGVDSFSPGPKTRYIYDLAANLKSGIAKGAFGSLGCFAKTIAASMSSRFMARTNATAADQFSATNCSHSSMPTSPPDGDAFDAALWANQVNAAFAKFAQRWAAAS